MGTDDTYRERTTRLRRALVPLLMCWGQVMWRGASIS
jgi:hypothetical protein